MRTCNVYKSMFFKMDASFKTSVKARIVESLAAVQLCEINSK